MRGLVASNGARPPAQGGISILGQDLVDPPGVEQPDRAVEIRGLTTVTHSANCAVLGSAGVNCSDKFQQFLIGCERPCDPAAKTFLGARCSVRLDTYSASAKATCGRISGFLREWVHSAPEDDSRPALWTSPCLRPGADCGSFSLRGHGRRRPRKLLVFYWFCWY